MACISEGAKIQDAPRGGFAEGRLQGWMSFLRQLRGLSGSAGLLEAFLEGVELFAELFRKMIAELVVESPQQG